MKNTLLILLASLMMAGCYKEDISGKNAPTGSSGTAGTGSATGSHYCGYTTKDGSPCRRLVSGNTGYCWQHK